MTALGRLGVALATVFGWALAGVAAISPAQADSDRLALVIGNAAYANVTKLDNPLTDAIGVSAALKRLGFDVVEGYDLTRDGMHSVVSDFASRLDRAKVTLVYYAGHGVSVGGENYLIPVDAKISSEPDLDFRTMNANLILRQIQRDERFNIFILDACRDNPFKEELSRSVGKTRSIEVGDGLSKIEAAGTLIAFSTDPGRKAFDGAKGENSPFAAALLKTIEVPGFSIGDVMDRVRELVWNSTNKKQRPWVNTNAIGRIYLAGAASKVASIEPAASGIAPVAGSSIAITPIAPSSSIEADYWRSTEKLGSMEGYQAYLRRFPHGAFVELAQTNIARLSIDPSGQRTVSDEDLQKAGPGTAATEKAMAWTPADRRQAYDRLRLLGFDPGRTANEFQPNFRKALTDWQKSRSVHETGHFTQPQKLALWELSENAFQKGVPSTERSVKVRSARHASGDRSYRAARTYRQDRGGGQSGAAGNAGEFFGGFARRFAPVPW